MPGSVAIASESRFANARTSRSFHINDCSPSSATGTIGSSVKPVLVCTVKTIARATCGNGGEDLVSATLIDWTFETGMSQSRLDLRHPMKATLPDSTDCFGIRDAAQIRDHGTAGFVIHATSVRAREESAPQPHRLRRTCHLVKRPCSSRRSPELGPRCHRVEPGGTGRGTQFQTTSPGG